MLFHHVPSLGTACGPSQFATLPVASGYEANSLSTNTFTEFATLFYL
jgi:hypothetical protein